MKILILDDDAERHAGFQKILSNGSHGLMHDFAAASVGDFFL